MRTFNSAPTTSTLRNWWYKSLMLILLVAGGFATGANAQTVTIGSGTTTSSYLPMYNYYGYNYTQQIYTAAQIGQAGKIDKIRFMVNAGGLVNGNDWVVYMGNTTKTTFATTTDWVPLASMTQVYSGTLSSAPPITPLWMEITLTTPFVYNGTDNLVIAVDENTPSYTSGTTWRAFASGTNTGIYYYNDTNNPDPASPPTANLRTATISQVQLNFLPPCTGTPVAGTVPASTPACVGSTVNLTATGGTVADGLTYQWLESSNGLAPWAAVTGGSGATTTSYTTPPFSTTAYYRMAITCTPSGITDTTNVATVIDGSTPPYAVFDGISLVQDFEAWTNGCSTSDRPSLNWNNTPSTGFNSWRRDNQGSSAGWTSSSGNYSPVFSSGARSARFHSVEAPNSSAGNLDLYVDMTAATGDTKLKFAHINVDGADVLNVSVSTNGGSTFTSLGPDLSQSATWAEHEYTLASTSATTVIRFKATSDLGVSDIGLDNLRLVTPCSGTPAVTSASATPPTVCSGNSTVITATGINTLAGISLQWEDSPDGSTGWAVATGGSGATTASYTTPALLAPRYYRLKQSCSYSTLSSYSNTVAVLMNTATYATYDNVSYTEDFESWISVCGTTDIPGTSWRNSPNTGNNSWRRDDQGITGAGWTNNTGFYSPVFTTGAHSARFHSYGTPLQGSLDLYMDMSAATGPTRLSFDHSNVNGTDILGVWVSTDGGQNFTQVGNNLGLSPTWTNRFFDFNSNSATTVVRLLATGQGSGDDIGVDNLLLAPSPTCVTPLNLVASIASPNSINLSWDASVSNPSSGYEWEVRTSGSAGGGGTGLEASGNTSTGTLQDLATPLTADQTYSIYVRANCGGVDQSGWAGPVFVFLGYCTPAPQTVTGTGITNVAFGTLNNPSGAEAGNYGNYSALPGGDVQQTLNADVAITFQTVTANYGTKIWVDWNNNLDFTDPGELMYTGLSGTTSPNTLNASFNVGSNPQGAYRMRIGSTDTNTGPSSPCYTETLGAFEDYTLNITAPPTCIAPTGLALTGVTGDSGTLSWTASPSSPSSGYELYANTTGTAPTGSTVPSVTGIMGTSGTVGSLTSGTMAYVWVRANCGGGDESVWTGPVSFTPGLAQVGSGTATSNYFPIRSYWGYSYSQQIYLASEYTGGTYITKIKFKPVSNIGTTANYKDWVVYMGNTAKTSFSSTTDWVPLASLSQVFNGVTVTPVANQWMEITLDTPFLWDGTSNILVAVDENTSGDSGSPGVNWQSFTAPSNRGIIYYSDPTNPAPASPPTANYGPNANIAQVQFVYSAPPACLPVTGLNASNITATSADLGWTANTPPPVGYQWEVRTTGAGGDGATGLTDSGTSTNSVASTAALVSSTNYHLYVRVDCGSSFSPWAGPYNFTTPCAAIPAPYIQNFDAASTLPNCWASIGTDPWAVLASGAPPGPDYGVNGAVDHTSGSGNYVWIDGSSDILANSLETPDIDMSALTTPYVSFWMLSNNTNDGAQNQIRLDAWDGAAWVALLTYGGNSASWLEHTATLPGGIPSTTKFRLVALPSSSGGSQFYNDLLIDDFSVIEMPTCLMPTGLTASNITATGADLSWTASISLPANGYQWEVRTSGAGGSGATGLVDNGMTAAGTVTANTALLAPGTTYTLYVRSDCNGTFSLWAGPFSFNTPPGCGGPFYDNGGPSAAYTNNANDVVTICPNSPGDQVTVTFSQFNTEASWDKLFVFNGNSTAAPMIASTNPAGSGPTQYGAGGWWGDLTGNLPGPFVGDSPNGCLTFAFVSDASGTYDGWTAAITCAPAPVCFTPAATATVQPDCGNGQYFIEVNLTGLGDATDVDIMSDYAGNPGGATAVSTLGPVSPPLGPFADLSTVNVTVVHNGNNTCNLVLAPITYDCADYGKNALSFDGVDDRVDCGNTASLDITGNKITLEAWIYPTSWRTYSYQGNIINTEDNLTHGFMLRCGATGQLSFNLGDGTAWHEIVSPINTLTLNTWQHVAGTYDGSTMRMYLNGAQIGSLAASFNIGSTGNSMVIGDWSNGTGRNFPGKIDEVRVWNKTVGASSLLSHLNTAYCGDENGLVAYYKFDQGVENGNNAGVTTLTDLTANTNDGTLTGFALTGTTSNWVAGQTNMGACVPVTCFTPLNVALSNITETGFDISWTDNGSAGYTYEVRTSGLPGSGATGLVDSGTPTSGTPAIAANNILANQDYQVYVQANCGGGNGDSEWSSAVNVHTGYCAASSTSTTYYITGFSTTGGSTNISNNGTGQSVNGYGDYSSMSVGQYAGASVNFTATFATTASYYLRIWVDWNHDLDFNDAGESVYFSGSYLVSPVSGTITVPSGTALGAYRMRVHNSELYDITACGADPGYGEIEDYTFTVTAPPACLPPTALAAAITSATSADLSWTASTSAPADGYNWEVRSSGAGGSGSGGLEASGSTLAGVTTASATPIPASMTMILYVQSNCGTANQSSWAQSSSFFTGYCTPAPTSVDNQGITNVAFGTLNNPSGDEAGHYGDYTGLVGGDVQQTTTATVNITYETGYTYDTKIWVDWNNDLDFNDVGENVYTGVSLSTNPTTLVATFNVGTNPLGSYRMRIGGVDVGPPTPCYTGSYGTFEDYTLNITAPPACPTPTNTAVTAITATSASFSWTDNGSLSYKYEVRTSGAAGSGATGLALSGNVAGSPVPLTLVPNTTYAAYVKSMCTGPDSSAWSIAVNFTTPCLPSAIPYTEDFNSVGTPAIPSCMSIQTPNGAAWTTSGFPPTGMTGNAGYNYGYATTTSNTSAWLYTAGMNLTGGTSYRVSFKYSNQYNFYTDALKVAYGISAQESGMTSVLADYTAINDGLVHAVTMDFTPATTDVYYIGFQKHSPSANYGYYMYVDDISVVVTPSCEAPTALATTAVTSTSASFSWTASVSNPANGYQWEVRDGASTVIDNGTTAAGVTTASTSVALTPNTPYQLWVRSDCGTEFSLWAGPFNFTTLCTNVTSYPYLESFGAAMPGCWSASEGVAGASQHWTPTTADATHGAGAPQAGTHFMYLYTYLASTTYNPYYMTTGSFDLGATPKLLSYYYYLGSGGYQLSPVPMTVQISTNGGTTWTNLYQHTSANSTFATGTTGWTQNTIDLTAYANTVATFRYVSNSNYGSGYCDQGIDEFSIYDVPSCFAPTALGTTAVTTTSASFSWTASTSLPANGYQWEVRDGASTVIDNGTTAAGVTTASTSVALTPNTSYQLWVRSDCGSGFSFWAGPLAFYTGYCTPVGTSSSYYVNNFSTTGGYANISNLNSGFSAGGYGNFTGQSVSASAGNAVSFTASFLLSSTYYFNIWVDWNNDLDFGDAGEQVYASGTYVSSGAGTITVPLGTPSGNYRMRIRNSYIGDVGSCGSSSYGEAEDYTFTVSAPPTCLGPTALLASPGVNSATLNWTASTSNPANGYEWEVRTSGAGGSGATGLVANGNTAAGVTTANAGGLSSNSPYSFYVRANCGAGDWSVWSQGSFTTGAACGDGFTDTGGPSAAYSDNENYVKTYCRSTPGDQVRVLFSSFSTEASYDKLFIFNGNSTAAPKFASANGNGFGNTSYGAGGWWGDLTSALPGPFTSSNASGCLTFAFVSDGSGTAPGWNATTTCVTPNNTCAAATPVLCGNVYSGVTSGVPHSMPASACAFNGAPSTGGQNWFLYTGGASDEAVTLSTCGNANFDTRISVFTGADCNNLSCVSFADDNPGCATGSSEITFTALAGTSYWIAVHGAGTAEGSYQLTLSCAAPCAAPANDGCANAQGLTNTVADGSGTPATYTNICASVDAPTTCSGALPVQGVWFSFNSGPYDHALITLLDNGEDNQYSATTLDYALFTGGCGGLGASGSVACATDAAGTNVLNVAQNTPYLLLVYNTGGNGVAGTFGLMVEHPAHNDAAITAILDPAPGILCSSVMAPQVTLLNNGDNNLTSVQITYGLSLGVPHVYNWTGNLAYGATSTFTLPTVAAEAGDSQTLTVATSLPNGVADDIPANDSQGVGLDVGGEPLVVKIKTDNDASQLQWVIYDEFFIPVAQGGPYAQANTVISEYHCLSTSSGNCFMFQLTDGFGDGLCCANGNGYWALRTPAGGLLLRDIFDATVDGNASPTYTPQNPNYPFGHSVCLPPGPANIAPTECGIFTNTLLNKVYCNKVTGASNYQFEFSDPDAGYIRRIARNRNYVIFTEMQSVPLTPGVKYFARVRTDRDGPLASAHFGTGCEMGLGLAQVVPCTELIHAPAYGHSCDETRTFNTSANNSFIYAKPVVGGTEYQFRLINTQEGYDQTFIRSTYILMLKWNTSVAPLLQDGYTYNVQINVKVNGLYSGFCASDCDITIDNSGNRPEASMTQATFGEATMWPNPVRDGQVNLNIEGLVDNEQNITVDIQDIYGKQVFAKEFGNSGERFNTILNLSSDIASGVYMVNITVNGKRTVQRLSIIR